MAFLRSEKNRGWNLPSPCIQQRTRLRSDGSGLLQAVPLLESLYRGHSFRSVVAGEVTNAVIADFLINGVFAEGGKNITNPDAVMTGEIKHFYGRAGLNTAGWITLIIYPTWLLGVPMQSSEGEVDLEVSIRWLDGTVLGTYSGRSEFSDWYTMYNQSIHGVGTALNKAFNQAMQQIRERIIADKNKF